MLTILRSIKDVNFDALMHLYQDNVNNSSVLSNQYGNTLEAAQERYQYLKECFFTYQGAFCAAWAVESRYDAFLRLEPYRDGYLLEGLTVPSEVRNQGYATKLILSVLNQEYFPKGSRIYSHVDKKNLTSLRVHEKCGFSFVSDCAALIDGSLTSKAYTLLKII